jgi:hypothetical protein
LGHCSGDLIVASLLNVKTPRRVTLARLLIPAAAGVDRHSPLARLGKALQSKNNSAEHPGDAVVVVIEMSGVLLRKQEPG